MKQAIGIILIVILSLAALFTVIFGTIWLFSDPFNIVADEVHPSRQEVQTQCLKDNEKIVYERYAQCVKDAGGNNVRCRDTARMLTCPY